MSVYSATNDNGYNYDGELIDSYTKNKSTSSRQFVIFHFTGQHIAAEERYPHTNEFMRFTADSIQRNEPFLTKEKKEKIAHYDNATLYNDYVIKKIMDLFREENAVMVYLSDHGEEVYDYRDSEGRCGGETNKNLLLYQYGVPFVIWCSPIYQERHPETMEAIRGAVDRPFMTDNVCQVLFHLAGIESSYYKPERDLLSDDYKRPKRLVNRTIDYDAIVHAE